MKWSRVVPALLLAIFSAGCTKEAVTPIDREIELFKTYSSLQFQGKVFDQSISWSFANWQNGIGAYWCSYRCLTTDTTIQQRNFAIYDFQQREDLTFLQIKSPAIRTTFPYYFKRKFFERGTKEFQTEGMSIFDGFIVEGWTKLNFFTSYYGDQEGSKFEVVKMEELFPGSPELPDYKKVRLWILVSCNLYDLSGKKIGRMERGKFIVEIEIERN